MAQTKNAVIKKRQEVLCNSIDNMPIYTEDYASILNLINNMPDALFAKLMDEVIPDNDDTSTAIDYELLRDFAEAVDSKDFQTKIAACIENQDKLYFEYTNLMTLIKQYEIVTDGDKQTLLQLAATDEMAYKADDTMSLSLRDIDKQNIITSLLTNEETSGLENIYLNKILSNVMLGDTNTIDSLVLSNHEFLVPVDMRYIIITDNDRIYMRLNNITDDEMKKIKSLAVFSAVSYTPIKSSASTEN